MTRRRLKNAAIPPGTLIYTPKYLRLQEASQGWPEVAALRGVEVAKRHERYKVRSLSRKLSAEVLILPSAPLFDLFLDRKRPALTSAKMRNCEK